MLAIALADGLEHWTVDLDRLPETARYVAAVIRDQYPTLAVPFHARWRHFAVGGVDLWGPAAEARDWLDPASRSSAAQRSEPATLKCRQRAWKGISSVG